MSGVFDDLLELFHAFLNTMSSGLVRDAVAEIGWTMPARPLPPRSLPCLAYLDRAEALASAAARPLVKLLADERSAFHWGQTYTAEEFGQRFIANYGWLELFGTRGHFVNDQVAAGFLLLGPEIIYPDHHHIAEEIYIPLTGGTEWRMGDGPFRTRPAGEIVHHASNITHAMRTGAEPLVALYLWRGGPLAQKSVIGGSG